MYKNSPPSVRHTGRNLQLIEMFFIVVVSSQSNLLCVLLLLHAEPLCGLTAADGGQARCDGSRLLCVFQFEGFLLPFFLSVHDF